MLCLTPRRQNLTSHVETREKRRGEKEAMTFKEEKEREGMGVGRGGMHHLIQHVTYVQIHCLSFFVLKGTIASLCEVKVSPSIVVLLRCNAYDRVCGMRQVSRKPFCEMQNSDIQTV